MLGCVVPPSYYCVAAAPLAVREHVIVPKALALASGGDIEDKELSIVELILIVATTPSRACHVLTFAQMHLRSQVGGRHGRRAMRVKASICRCAGNSGVCDAAKVSKATTTSLKQDPWLVSSDLSSCGEAMVVMSRWVRLLAMHTQGGKV